MASFQKKAPKTGLGVSAATPSRRHSENKAPSPTEKQNDDEIENIRGELGKLSGKLADLSNTRDEVSTLRSKLADAEQESNARSRECWQVRAQMRAKAEELQAERITSEELRAQLVAAQDELDQRRREREEVFAAQAATQADIEATQARAQELQRSLTDAHARAEELQSDLAIAKTELVDFTAAQALVAQTLEDNLATARSACTATEIRACKFEETADELRAQLAVTRDELDKQQQEQQDIAAAHAREVQEFEARLSASRSDCSASEMLTCKAEEVAAELRAQLAITQDELGKQRQQHQEIAAAHAIETQEFETKLSASWSDCSASEVRACKAEEVAAELRAQLAISQDALDKQRQQQQEIVAAHASTIAEFEAKLSASLSDYSASEVRACKAEEVAAELKTQLVAKQEELDKQSDNTSVHANELQLSLSSRQALIERLQSDLAVAITESADSSAAHARAVEALEEKLSASETCAREAQDHVRRLQQDFGEMREEFFKAEKQAQTFQRELMASKQAVEWAKAQASDAEKVIEMHARDLESGNAALAAAETKIARLQALEADMALQKHKDLEQSKAASEEDLARSLASQRNDIATGEIQELRLELATLKEELAKFHSAAQNEKSERLSGGAAAARSPSPSPCLRSKRGPAGPELFRFDCHVEGEDLRLQNRELALTVLQFQQDCETLEAENGGLKKAMAAFELDLDQHAQNIGHANHKQKIRYTVQLKEQINSLLADLTMAKKQIVRLQSNRVTESLLDALASIGLDADLPEPQGPYMHSPGRARRAVPVAGRRRASLSGPGRTVFAAAAAEEDEEELMERLEEAERKCELQERAFASIGTDFLHLKALVERVVTLSDGEGRSDGASFAEVLQRLRGAIAAAHGSKEPLQTQE